MASNHLCARLKPFDPSKGHVIRSLTIVALGAMDFDEGTPVSGLTEDEAAYLRTVRMRPEDPKSPLAFDVLPESEMRKLVSDEAKDKLGLTPKIIAAVRDGLDSDDIRAIRRASRNEPDAPMKSAAYMRSRTRGDAGPSVPVAKPAKKAAKKSAKKAAKPAEKPAKPKSKASALAA